MEYEKLIAKTLEIGAGGDMSALEDCFNLIRAQEMVGAVTVESHRLREADTIVYDKPHFNAAHKNVKALRSLAAQLAKQGTFHGNIRAEAWSF